jgi:hypothetical protein
MAHRTSIHALRDGRNPDRRELTLARWATLSKCPAIRWVVDSATGSPYL